ncbi:MAG: Rieske 2Fe-2S domain-containing protein [Cyclobacteriaceae bacterium]|nr:Rieske 2Fe-2S domain-containing protein [Cyclobacteriaceae bacterium]
MEAALTVNKPRLLLAGGKRICLVRTPEQLLAVEDKCSHNGESLSRGQVNYLGEVVCPWHGYRFNLRTGRESGERSNDLEVFPTRADEDGVFVGI